MWRQTSFVQPLKPLCTTAYGDELHHIELDPGFDQRLAQHEGKAGGHGIDRDLLALEGRNIRRAGHRHQR